MPSREHASCSPKCNSKALTRTPRQIGRQRRRSLSPMSIKNGLTALGGRKRCGIGHEGEYERIFRTHIEPRIGSTKIALLDKATIKIEIEEIRKATTNSERGHRGLQASRALQLIRSVCRYALGEDYCDRDPTFGINRPVPDANPDGKQNRPPTNDELKALWVGRRHYAAEDGSGFRLTVLLGKRISELLGALKIGGGTGRECKLVHPWHTRRKQKPRRSTRAAPTARAETY